MLDPTNNAGSVISFNEEGIVVSLPRCRQSWRHVGVIVLLGVLLPVSMFSRHKMQIDETVATPRPTTTTTPLPPTPPTTTTSSCCGGTSSFVSKFGSGVTLADEETKLLLVGTPKGGATLTTQLMFRYLNLTETAKEYSKRGWIHDYRLEKFVKQPQHRPRPCRTVCGDWTCLKLVRSPFDRIVSSYIHIMKTHLKDSFEELHLITTTPYVNATFADFIWALSYRNQTNSPQRKGENHFMPQSDWGGLMGCDDPIFWNNVSTTKHSSTTTHQHDAYYWIPVEAIHDGLDLFYTRTGIRLNATGFSSTHYVSKHKDDHDNYNNFNSTVYRNYFTKIRQENPNVSLWPPPISQKNNHHVGKTVPYEAYFDNSTLNQIFCQLYCRDIDLYLYSVCHQTWLTSNSMAVQQLCHQELERVNIICGESFL